MTHARGPLPYPITSTQNKQQKQNSYEAQNLFLELDNLREAAKFNRPKVEFCVDDWRGCRCVWTDATNRSLIVGFDRPRPTPPSDTAPFNKYNNNIHLKKQAAEKAYAKIALAYDRFRKAGDLYGGCVLRLCL